MKLLTKALAKKIPALYAQEEKGDEAIAYVKFFTPDAHLTWYVTEMDQETGECFGLVIGDFVELGKFTLADLQETRGKMGLPVERDRWFDPTPLKALK